MHRYDDKQAAEVCHWALRGLQKVQGTGYQSPVLEEMHQDLRDAAIEGVSSFRRGEAPSAREHHGRWVRFLEDRDWKQGERDPAAKTHPNLTDWDELTEDERDKTRLFLSTVMSLTLGM